MVTMIASAAVHVVSFLAAAPVVSAVLFVPPMDMSPGEPSRKRRRVDSPWETTKLLATFEELWASSRSFSPIASLSFAPPLRL